MVEPTAWNEVARDHDYARLWSMKRTFGMNRQQPAVLGRDADALPVINRCLVLAPHPDDFDVVAVTLRRIAAAGAKLHLEVLTSGASGVEDAFAEGWSRKTLAREAEQLASCRIFGLPEERIRFHRLAEDEGGHMESGAVNEARVWTILDRVLPDAVILPHGRDSNADHQRTFRMFEKWAKKRSDKTLALLVRDPKTLEMRLDLVTPFNQEEAEWKAEMLRCHASQHERNLRSRGYGIDERILRMNREIASQSGCGDDYAEGFEIRELGKAR